MKKSVKGASRAAPKALQSGTDGAKGTRIGATAKSDLTKLPKIISILNQKGGVGKTTTSLNLGAGLAMSGLKVLLIDLDVQCNLTHMSIGDLGEGDRSICEAMLEEKGLDNVIRETSTKGLYIAPAGESLIALEINLANMIGRENVLSHSLKLTKGLRQFDVVIIDNPPFVSLTTLNSLVASDFYLVPLSCEYLPMLGLKWLNRTVEKVKKLNPRLAPIGVALTMYDQRQAITKSVEELVREELGDLVFETRIRISTKHKTAPTVQKTIFQYDPKGKGSVDYMGLTNEVIRRLGHEQEG